jgi:hypothetical protein
VVVQKGEGFRLLGKCGVSVFRQAFYTELNEEMAREVGPDNEKNHMIPWETEDSKLYIHYDL